MHAHVDHAYALMDEAAAQGAKKIRLHLLLDGRDVSETSALEYLAPLEAKCVEMAAAGIDMKVASGGGRMNVTMDRYNANWEIVERGWKAHVLGEAPHTFSSASEAVQALRGEGKEQIIDQFLPPFVITGDDGAACGTIEDGDSVTFFNFRGDRALELTKAFEFGGDDFPYFDRQRVPEVRYAGMMQYDGDDNLPTRYVVPPPIIDNTVGEYLAANGLKQLAISETQKFGHVTFFFNGNRSGKFNDALEQYVEVPSYKEPENERPWMRAAEITDLCLKELDSFKPDFVRLNYANGDMVGHTGDLRATKMAMEAVDMSAERLIKGIIARGGIAVVTADHGNADEMGERDKSGKLKEGDSDFGFKPLTSHTLSLVPVAVVGAGVDDRYEWDSSVSKPGLANISATCINLLGLEDDEEEACCRGREEEA